MLFSTISCGDNQGKENAPVVGEMKMTKKESQKNIGFKPTLVKADLEQLQIKEQKLGVIITYDSVRYKADSTLSYIAFSVDFGDGNKQQTAAQLDTLTQAFGIQYRAVNDTVIDYFVGSYSIK